LTLLLLLLLFNRGAGDARGVIPPQARTEDTAMAMPRSYRTIEEFQREELQPSNKAGFSLDDLMQETMLHESDLLFDDQHDEYEPEDEDDDDY
jgi:hypothetical protein